MTQRESTLTIVHPPDAAASVAPPAPIARGAADDRLAQLAAEQGGAFTRLQALAAGVPPGTISGRLVRGRWQLVLPGVYAAGHIEPLTRVHAATLWLPTGVLSHLAACWLWGLLDEPPAVVHLTVAPSCTRRGPAWLRLVRRELGPSWHVRGLRVVPPERAVLDGVAVLDPAAAARLVDRALLRRITVDELRDRHWRDLGCRGSSRAYTQLVSAVPGAASVAERTLARAAWRAGLRGLLVNQRVLDYVVDLYEPELRLAVEVDGYRFHSSRDAFHHDRVRQNALVAAGYTVLRFTAEQVLTDVADVVAETAVVADRLRHRS